MHIGLFLQYVIEKMTQLHKHVQYDTGNVPVTLRNIKKHMFRVIQHIKLNFNVLLTEYPIYQAFLRLRLGKTQIVSVHFDVRHPGGVSLKGDL